MMTVFAHANSNYCLGLGAIKRQTSVVVDAACAVVNWRVLDLYFG